MIPLFDTSMSAAMTPDTTPNPVGKNKTIGIGPAVGPPSSAALTKTINATTNDTTSAMIHGQRLTRSSSITIAIFPSST
jgi:hypothetical protein